jgi:hypothetical protein
MASFSDESIDSGHGRLVDSTHPPPNKQRLLPEIISHIISFVIPNGGLTISNDLDRNSDFDTIMSLLKTSIKIKNETLRQIYRQSLHLVILMTSRKQCPSRRCETGGCGQGPLFRAARLPLSNWPVVNIHFAPVPGSSSYHGPPSVKPLSLSNSTYQVDLACSRVKYQSAILAGWLKQYAVHEKTTLKTAFTFAEVWMDSTDNTQQPQFLYNVWTIVDFMSPWKWTAATPEAFNDQIKFPHMLFTGYLRHDNLPDDHEAAGSQGIVEDIERQFSAWWSPQSQVMLRLSFDMGGFYYLLGWSYTQYGAMFADELSDGIGLLCIKITPDMTAGDNGLGDLGAGDAACMMGLMTMAPRAWQKYQARIFQPRLSHV